MSTQPKQPHRRRSGPNRHRLAIVCALAAHTIVSAIAARADRIERYDNRVIEGVILRMDDTMVLIKDGTAEIKIPRASIRRIIRGGPSDRHLIAAKTAFNQGQIAQAIHSLGLAAEGGSHPDSLAAVMVRYSEEIVRMIPRLSAGGRRELSATLDAIETAQYPRQGDLIVARLHWRLDLGEIRAVHALLTQLESRRDRTLKQRRPELLRWFNAHMDRALDAGEFTEALDLLIEMRRLDNRRAGGRKAELVLLWARGERDRAQFEAALEIYAEQLIDLTPFIARDRIWTTLEEADRYYRDRQQIGRSIDLLERYGLQYVPDKAEEHLIAAWRDLGRQILRGGDWEGARKFFHECNALIAGSADRDLFYCDYQMKKAAIKPGDHREFYLLGDWCVQSGLPEEALEAFAIAAQDESLRSYVSEQVRRIDHTLAEKELAALMDLYEEGRYMETLRGLTRFRHRPMARGFKQQADRLEEFTREMIKASRVQNNQEAEARWQQAERAYFTGDRERALSLLEFLIANYEGTPGGERALEFYRAVRPGLTLDRLEKRRQADFDVDFDSSGGEGISEIAQEIRRLREGIDASRELP